MVLTYWFYFRTEYPECQYSFLFTHHPFGFAVISRKGQVWQSCMANCKLRVDQLLIRNYVQANGDNFEVLSLIILDLSMRRPQIIWSPVTWPSVLILQKITRHLDRGSSVKISFSSILQKKEFPRFESMWFFFFIHILSRLGNNNAIFHKFSCIVTWVHCCCLRTVQTSWDPYSEVGSDQPRTCACCRALLPLALEESLLSKCNLRCAILTSWWA